MLIRRQVLSDADLASILAEYVIDGPVEIVGSLRVGRGKDALRLCNVVTAIDHAGVIQTLKQFNAVFPRPKRYGKFRVDRSELPALFTHSRYVRARAKKAAERLYVDGPRDKKIQKLLDSAAFGNQAWLMLCHADIRNLKNEMGRIVRDGVINQWATVPLHGRKWCKDIDYVKKNLTKWAEMCGIDIEIKPTATGVKFRRKT